MWSLWEETKEVGWENGLRILDLGTVSVSVLDSIVVGLGRNLVVVE